MTGANDYDGTVALDVEAHGKLMDSEMKSLKSEQLQPLFENAGGEAEDVNDILDYAFAMVNNGKTMEYVVQELVGMEMEFCPSSIAHTVAKILAEYLQEHKPSNGGGGDDNGGDNEQQEDGDEGEEGNHKRVVSLKSKTEGNALTMSGALGSQKKPKGNALTMSGALGSNRSAEKDKKGNKKDNDHRRGEGRGGRGGRGRDSTNSNRRDGGGGRGGAGRNNSNDRRGRQAAAFDRLAHRDNHHDDGGGPPRRQFSRGYDDDPRRGGPRDGGRGRGGRGGGPRDGGRGGRGGGPRDGGRGGRGGGGRASSGNRRSRDDMEQDPEEDYMAAPPGGRGRGRGGRGRGSRDGRGSYNDDGGANKRMRVEGGAVDEDPNAYYDESYGGGYEQGGYDDGSYGYYPPYRGGGFRGRGGRGRGFRGGRGRFPPGRGRGPFAGGAAEDGAAEGGGGEGQEGGAESGGGDMSAEAAEFHPSPMVAAAYRGGGYGFRGRGRGRGRGRFAPGRGFPGRTEVVSMIASKTWVRPKEGGNDNQDGGGGQDSGGAES